MRASISLAEFLLTLAILSAAIYIETRLFAAQVVISISCTAAIVTVWAAVVLKYRKDPLF